MPPAPHHHSMGKVAKNSLYVLLSRGVDTGIGILLITLSARYMLANFGVEINGQFAFLVTLIGLVFTLSNAGLAQIIIRDVAKDKSQAALYLRSALILRLLLGFICFLIVIALSIYLPISQKMRFGILILAVSEMGNVITWNYINMFNAFERMDYEAYATFIFRAVALLCTLMVIRLHLDWLYLFVAITVASYLRTIYVIWQSRPLVKSAPTHDWKKIKVIFVEALPIGIALLLTQGYLRIDALVLQRLSTYREIALFYYPFQILLQVNIIPLALTTALFPIMARAGHTQDNGKQGGEIEKIFIPTFKFFFILSLPIMVFGFLYATPIMVMLFTDAFTQSGFCLQILIWGTFFVFVELLMSHSLIATGHQKVLFLANGSCLAVNFIVDVILIKYFHLGAIGASIGTISAYATLFLILLYHLRKTVALGKMFQQTPKPFITALLCGLLFYPLRNYVWYIMVPMGFIVYIAILFATRTFSENEIQMFKGLARPPGPPRTT